MGLKTSLILLVVTVLVIGGGAYAASQLNPAKATLGDWGDYVGGLVGIITLIWLVTGHFQNQIALRETTRELQAQAELTQEVVGALTRIASGTQVQAAGVLAEAEPLFVHLSSTADATGSKQFEMKSTAESGYIAFRNDGGSVTFVKLESLTVGYEGKFVGPHILATESTFKISVKSTKPLIESGAIHFVVHVNDAFQRLVKVEIEAARFDASPKISVKMGKQTNGQS